MLYGVSMNSIDVYSFIAGIMYAQIINIYESLKWIGRLWSLEPPLPPAPSKPNNDGYHLVLAIAYILPFLPLAMIDFASAALGVITTWTFNDLTWHFWSVKPKYWAKWMRFYFNPTDRRVVWYARMKLFSIPVSPSLMFFSTIMRVIIMIILCYF